jgi:hypothetical protein
VRVPRRSRPDATNSALQRGDVLQHQAQPRKALQQRRQHALDEDPLAVEDVDLGVGHLAVHQQRQAVCLHARQRGGAFRMSVTPASELVVAPAG